MHFSNSGNFLSYWIYRCYTAVEK